MERTLKFLKFLLEKLKEARIWYRKKMWTLTNHMLRTICILMAIFSAWDHERGAVFISIAFYVYYTYAMSDTFEEIDEPVLIPESDVSLDENISITPSVEEIAG